MTERTRPHVPSAGGPAAAPNARLCRCPGCLEIRAGSVDRLAAALRRTGRMDHRTRSQAVGVVMGGAGAAVAGEPAPDILARSFEALAAVFRPRAAPEVAR